MYRTTAVSCIALAAGFLCFAAAPGNACSMIPCEYADAGENGGSDGQDCCEGRCPVCGTDGKTYTEWGALSCVDGPGLYYGAYDDYAYDDGAYDDDDDSEGEDDDQEPVRQAYIGACKGDSTTVTEKPAKTTTPQSTSGPVTQEPNTPFNCSEGYEEDVACAELDGCAWEPAYDGAPGHLGSCQPSGGYGTTSCHRCSDCSTITCDVINTACKGYCSNNQDCGTAAITGAEPCGDAWCGTPFASLSTGCNDAYEGYGVEGYGDGPGGYGSSDCECGASTPPSEGEPLCEGHGYTSDQCAEIGCCHFNVNAGNCYFGSDGGGGYDADFSTCGGYGYGYGYGGGGYGGNGNCTMDVYQNETTCPSEYGCEWLNETSTTWCTTKTLFSSPDYFSDAMTCMNYPVEACGKDNSSMASQCVAEAFEQTPSGCSNKRDDYGGGYNQWYGYESGEESNGCCIIVTNAVTGDDDNAVDNPVRCHDDHSKIECARKASKVRQTYSNAEMFLTDGNLCASVTSPETGQAFCPLKNVTNCTMAKFQTSNEACPTDDCTWAEYPAYKHCGIPEDVHSEDVDFQLLFKCASTLVDDCNSIDGCKVTVWSHASTACTQKSDDNYGYGYTGDNDWSYGGNDDGGAGGYSGDAYDTDDYVNDRRSGCCVLIVEKKDDNAHPTCHNNHTQLQCSTRYEQLENQHKEVLVDWAEGDCKDFDSNDSLNGGYGENSAFEGACNHLQNSTTMTTHAFTKSPPLTDDVPYNGRVFITLSHSNYSRAYLHSGFASSGVRQNILKAVHKQFKLPQKMLDDDVIATNAKLMIHIRDGGIDVRFPEQLDDTFRPKLAHLKHMADRSSANRSPIGYLTLMDEDRDPIKLKEWCHVDTAVYYTYDGASTDLPTAPFPWATAATTVYTPVYTITPATTTAPYKPGSCEAVGCGSRIPPSDCDDKNDHGDFARTHCPLLCGLACPTGSTTRSSSTRTTATTTSTLTTLTDTTTTTATTTTATATTTTYMPQRCNGVLESDICGHRVHPADCELAGDVGDLARSQCAVMCGISCTSTATTATSTTATTTTTPSSSTTTNTASTTSTTTSATETTATTTTYIPQPCNDVDEAYGCGSRVPKTDCKLNDEHGIFAREHCPTLCELPCTSTTTTTTGTDTTTTTTTSTETTETTVTTTTTTDEDDAALAAAAAAAASGTAAGNASSDQGTTWYIVGGAVVFILIVAVVVLGVSSCRRSNDMRDGAMASYVNPVYAEAQAQAHVNEAAYTVDANQPAQYVDARGMQTQVAEVSYDDSLTDC